LISLRDIASIIEVTLILTIIGQCETKHMTLLLRNGNVSFEGLDIHNITSITAHPIGLAAILTVIFIY